MPAMRLIQSVWRICLVIQLAAFVRSVLCLTPVVTTLSPCSNMHLVLPFQLVVVATLLTVSASVAFRMCSICLFYAHSLHDMCLFYAWSMHVLGYACSVHVLHPFYACSSFCCTLKLPPCCKFPVDKHLHRDLPYHAVCCARTELE